MISKQYSILMSYAKTLRSILFLALLAWPFQPAFSAVKDRLSSIRFARDGSLGDYEAALFFLYRTVPDMDNVADPGFGLFVPAKLVSAMTPNLTRLKTATGHGAPWTWREIDHHFVAGKESDTEGFRVRDNVASLNVELANTKGATLSFSRNRLKENGTSWNTAGAVGYRTTIDRTVSSSDGGSSKTVIIPAISWMVSKAGGAPAVDVEELSFSLPLYLIVNPGYDRSSLWMLGLRPYCTTDFSFSDRIYGAEASAEFTGYVPGTSLYLGGYVTIPGTRTQYQLRFVPKIDYSVTGEGGIHTTRHPGDDWLTIGGLTSFDVLVSPHLPLALGVTYEFRSVLDGKGSNVHLFSPMGILWLDNLRNVALTLGYSKGKTLQTAQDIDLMMLGFQWKY